MGNVTNVKIYLNKFEGNVKATASVTIADAWAIHDIKVVEGEKGIFVSMPSKKKQRVRKQQQNQCSAFPANYPLL